MLTSNRRADMVAMDLMIDGFCSCSAVKTFFTDFSPGFALLQVTSNLCAPVALANWPISAAR
ncbi:hypothetical protein D3C85_1654550 [compost metagenome]